MRIFIDARGHYDVMPLTENFVLGCFTNCQQAVAYVRAKGFEPVYQWFTEGI